MRLISPLRLLPNLGIGFQRASSKFSLYHGLHAIFVAKSLYLLPYKFPSFIPAFAERCKYLPILPITGSLYSKIQHWKASQ